MIDTIFGSKLDTTRRFNENGRSILITRIKTDPCFVIQIRNEDKDGYDAIQVGWGVNNLKKTNKPFKGHIKGAKLKKAPLNLDEVRIGKINGCKVGDKIEPIEVIKPGDKVKITGRSKGRGFTGVVKRWGFKGGPRTHGQSDRQRSPGSIGQGTTPGRVFKGKKMAGRSGSARTTIAGLTVMEVDSEKGLILVKGLVSGPRWGKLRIKKVGVSRKFVSLVRPGEKKIGKTEEAEIKKPETEKKSGKSEKEKSKPEKEKAKSKAVDSLTTDN